MKLPWKRHAEAQVETEIAKRQYERAIETGGHAAQILTVLFTYAERNEFSEKIQRVARGR